mgnify:CR=1 FL=1
MVYQKSKVRRLFGGKKIVARSMGRKASDPSRRGSKSDATTSASGRSWWTRRRPKRAGSCGCRWRLVGSRSMEPCVRSGGVCSGLDVEHFGIFLDVLVVWEGVQPSRTRLDSLVDAGLLDRLFVAHSLQNCLGADILAESLCLGGEKNNARVHKTGGGFPVSPSGISCSNYLNTQRTGKFPTGSDCSSVRGWSWGRTLYPRAGGVGYFFYEETRVAALALKAEGEK